METIKNYILEQVASRQLSKDEAKKLLKDLHSDTPEVQAEDVAIIGISCRLPGARNKEEFWSLLDKGASSIGRFPAGRRKDVDHLFAVTDEDPYKIGGYLEELDTFDHTHFRISPREAELMDPAQRLFLQTAWEALEDAGIAGTQTMHTLTGIYVGIDTTGGSSYARLTEEIDDPLMLAGASTSIVASRLSYILDLKGPALVVDTACSSSLVALHMASKAVASGEVGMAIVGGVALSYIPLGTHMLDSADSRIRTFDKEASGTVWGEGINAIVLKPLSAALRDQNSIYAVIKGSAVNNDGTSNGITAPNARSQEEVITRAWKDAGIQPDTIDYVEAHGTGTKLGDPIEIKGLTDAFRKFTNRRQFCGIGSVKTNIGHTIGASGLASVIKMALSLKKKAIPPTLNVSQPNPFIPFDDSPLYIHDKRTDWIRGSHARRCGVSSFGFSGTNCHLIMEEAPWSENPAVQASEPPGHVFTLSAKSQEALSDLVKTYCGWLAAHPDSNIGDICKTINMGRTHHHYRLAVTARSSADLLKKLEGLPSIGSLTLPFLGSDVYCGVHSVVTIKTEHNRDRVLLESEKNELTRKANESIRLMESSGWLEPSAAQIGQWYIEGADIQWEFLYKKHNYRTLHLPTYPFEKHRHWIERKAADRGSEYEGQLPSLLNRRAAASYKQCIYEAALSPLDHWFVYEHRILGQYILPGTVYLELALQAAGDYLGTGCLVIENFQILSPLIFAEEEGKVIQTVLQEQGDSFAFSMVSLESQGANAAASEWTVHASGEIRLSQAETSGRINPPDLLDLMHRHEEEAVLLPERKDDGLALGLRWQGAVRIKEHEGAIVAKLSLPGQVAAETSQFTLHPALLDMATSIGAIKDTSNGLFLPVSYRQLIIHRALPATCYSLAKPHDSNDPDKEVLKYNITIWDESGQVAAEILDYTLIRKKIHQGRLNPLGRTAWLPEPLTAEIGGSLRQGGTVVIFADRQGWSSRIAACLLELGTNCVFVYRGSEYRSEEGNYFVGSDEQDYVRLFADLKLLPVTHIVYIHPGEDPAFADIDTVERFEANQKAGADSLIFTAKALLHHQYTRHIQLVLLTGTVHPVDGFEQTLNPGSAALIGLAKVIGQEYDHLPCRCIDFDETTSAETIIREMAASDHTFVTAFRSGIRYLEYFEEVEMTEKAEPKFVELKAEGVYVVTGGLGGIGYETSKQLFEQSGANVAFVHRTPLPGYLDLLKGTAEDKQLQRLARLEELNGLGMHAEYHTADIADWEEMDLLFTELRREYGRINGIIHCAGIAGSGLMLRKDIQSFYKVMEPKIKGTWVLDRLTLQDELDFLITFSSVASLIGGIGQSDYTAANYFLDRYADYRAKQGRRTLNLNWAAWGETGMAADHGVNKDTIFKALPTAQALELWEHVLQSDLSQAVIGELNLEDTGLLGQHKLMRLSPNVRAALEAQPHAEAGGRKAAVNKQAAPRVELTGKADNIYSEAELRIGQIWGQVLGLTRIDIYSDIYSLGGDSILAIHICNQISEQFDEKVVISHLFEHPTIHQLSVYMESLENPDEQAVGALSAETPVHSQPVQFTEQQQALQPDLKPEEYSEYELTSSQKRIWFLQQYDPQLVTYNLVSSLHLYHELDLEKLEAAMNSLIKRHDMLRAVFSDKDGQPQQKVLPDYSIKLECMELAGEAAEERLEMLLIEEQHTVFDLSKPLLRGKLFKLGSEHYCLSVSFHHLIMDGWSARIFFEELRELYVQNQNGEAPSLKPLARQYTDYADEQKNWITSKEANQMEHYWLEELAKPLPVLGMPLDYNRPHMQTFQGSHVSKRMDADTFLRLKEVTKRQGVTMNMILLSAYAFLLHKVSGDKDIIIGYPVAGRDRHEYERVLGLFMNMTCIRFKMGEMQTLEELIRYTKAKCLDAYRNGSYPFENIVAKLNPDRDLSRSPIFSTMFQYFEYAQENRGLSQFDLSLICKEESDEISIRLEYNIALFERQSIERFLDYYLNVIGAILERSQVHLAQVSLLSGRELRMLKSFNETEMAIPGETALGMFEKQSVLNPGLNALRFGAHTLTYAELNAQADLLAAALRKRGVRKGSIVGLLVGRSPELMVSILAIWKAGGAYLPLDPAYPKERLLFMLEDSGASILVTDSQRKSLLDFTGEIVLADTLHEPQSDLSGISASLHDLAYVIYTSGSTGRPKGVLLGHHSLSNFVAGVRSKIEFGPDKPVLCVTTSSFDIFILEAIVPLTAGAEVVLAGDAEQLDMQRLAGLIVKEQVRMVQMTPSRLQLLLLHGSRDWLSGVTEIMVGGEEFPPKLLSLLQEQTSSKIYNMYGPTETTIWSSVKELTAERVTIGAPIANTGFYVLDEHLQPLPVGVIGELGITGYGLAQGYMNLPDITEQKFVDAPFHDGAGKKMYLTGDLVKQLPDGDLIYLGRKDNQVKLRGHRIELSEIEQVLTDFTGISEAAAVVREEASGRSMICAYYTGDGEFSGSKLRAYMETKVPDYMIPSFFIKLDELPLTPNQKIDKKALPAPLLNVSLDDERYEAPANSIEETLVRLWQEVLEVPKVGIHDNFFDLGGDSLMSVMLIAKIKDYYPEVELQDMFKYTSISKMAKYLDPGTEAEASVGQETLQQTPSDDLDKILSLFDSVKKGDVSMDTALKNVEDWRE
ncbi:non-ribosomal peptide synthetase [Paenibacillus sp. FJAT-26967]|uniref:non-ribosomal peptide synthetase n=1 Tax=Paenibacillus sp. FJAT-26967 TaxID=1729690 RepID=UPI000837BCB4|nr:non-ribosomal peptide synthetase [Paenibacillus sp. FJAT-26967]